jgi:hypothetical protein
MKRMKVAGMRKERDFLYSWSDPLDGGEMGRFVPLADLWWDWYGADGPLLMRV